MCKGIREHVQDEYPEIISISERFPYEITFDIGFINPNIESYQGDGIANDETELTADNLKDLEELYMDFCEENDVPCDTVTYVEINDAETPYYGLSS